MSDNRNWIIEGMGRCVIIIEQQNLPGDTGGMLITSHDSELDYFKLHIIINSSLCNKTGLNERADQKIATIHEFTHTVAALSAISRVRSKILIERLREILAIKAHAIHFNEIRKLADELRNSLFDIMKKNIENDPSDSLRIESDNPKDADKVYHFPDEHFRLGFEDFPVSYPVIFEEFLLSKEMFDEYFTKDLIETLCNAFLTNNSQEINRILTPSTVRIINEKALYPTFAIARIMTIFLPIYVEFTNSLDR